MNTVHGERTEIDPAIIRLIRVVKARLSINHPTYDEARARLDEFEKQFEDHDLLWYWFEMVLHNPKDQNESVIERLGIPPWESTDEEVVVMWNCLTEPKQIPHLEQRANRSGINPHARRTTETALAFARKRAEG